MTLQLPNLADRDNPMLQPIRRWRGWPRAARRAPNRWRAWAGTRSGQRRRPDGPRPASGMTVLSRTRHVSITTERPRRTASAMQFLHVVVNPTLVAHRDAVLERQARVGPPASRTTVVRPARRSMALRPARGTMTVMSATPAAGAIRRTDRGGTPSSEVAWEGVPVRRAIEELVSHVVHAHQRVEVRAQGKATIREQPSVSAEVERALVAIQQQQSTARAGQIPAGMSWQAMPGVPGPTGAPGLDLERLTDQIVTRIDDRLIAHRERFGRAI